MANGSIQFDINNSRMNATAHTGGEVRPQLCASKGLNEFLSLEWVDHDQPPGGPHHYRTMHVYLERGEVESLRDLLTEQLAKMTP